MNETMGKEGKRAENCLQLYDRDRRAVVFSIVRFVNPL